jgi:hypothetical protein
MNVHPAGWILQQTLVKDSTCNFAPAVCYNAQAKVAMTIFNTLIDNVAADETYLEQTLQKAAQHDDFTGRLLKLMEASAPARAAAAAPDGVPEVVLGVHRSDYMLDAPTGGFLQVEGGRGLVSVPGGSNMGSRQLLTPNHSVAPSQVCLRLQQLRMYRSAGRYALQAPPHQGTVASMIGFGGADYV